MGIRLKRSAAAGKVPAVTDLELGELAVNSWDGKLYLRKNDGTDAITEVGPVRSVAGRTGAVTLGVADVASLQTALDGKQAAGSYAAATHTHAIADVTGLQAALNAASAGKQSIWVPVGAMWDMATAPEVFWPDFGYSIIKLSPTVEQGAGFTLMMPKAWDRGPITIRYVWSHPATTVNFGVAFSISAFAAQNGQAMTDPVWIDLATVTDTGGATNTVYITDEFTTADIESSDNAEEFITFWFSRKVANAADTLAVDCYLHGIFIKYNTTSMKDD